MFTVYSPNVKMEYKQIGLEIYFFFKKRSHFVITCCWPWITLPWINGLMKNLSFNYQSSSLDFLHSLSNCPIHLLCSLSSVNSSQFIITQLKSVWSHRPRSSISLSLSLSLPCYYMNALRFILYPSLSL